MQNKPLLSRPRADAVSVEDLVEWVRDGRIRIPDFQRPLRWRGRHVEELFDSLWLGYPVGSILFWQRPAADAMLELGPLRIKAPARLDALWVVDGQQRLTALACALLHPHPATSTSDIFALWFDLEMQCFVRPKAGDDIPASWLPLNRVLDAVSLGEWWNANEELSGQSELYRVALQLGKRVRESKLPVYIVETEDPAALKIIFARLNTSGVAMRETEVFTALHSVEGARGPLAILGEVGREARVGTLEDRWSLRCLRTVAGEQLDSPPKRELDIYREVVGPAVWALGQALDFLRVEAHIPHLRMMPYRLPLVALTRFFHLHPEPGPRSRILLRRWFWRGIVNQRHKDSGNPHLRWISEAIDDDEVLSIKRMLADAGQVGFDDIAAYARDVAHGARSFNAAPSKVQGALLAHGEPRHLETGELIDVSLLIDEAGPNAWRKVARDRDDRIIHPYLDHPVEALNGASPELQRSHFWPGAGASEEARKTLLEERFTDMLLAWCEPGMPDLPSLALALAGLGEE